MWIYISGFTIYSWLYYTMFLSKKNAEYLNRPKKGKTIEQRVLPGWGDDDDNETKQDFKHEYKTNNYTKNV